MTRSQRIPDRSHRILALTLGLAACATSGPITSRAPNPSGGPTVNAANAIPMRDLVPMPVSIQPDPTATFTLSDDTVIAVPAASPELAAIGAILAERLRPATGFPLPVRQVHDTGTDGAGAIAISVNPGDATLGDEGYRLSVSGRGITIIGGTPAGVVHGITTIRQLLPPAIERGTRQPGPWVIGGGRIVDLPRYRWRGAMLDVARHFFPVADVERYIDEISLYKLNILHLHLSDDQGWRIAIDSWPKLASHGGSTAVNGDPGGFYSKADYQRIVAYAAARYITIVPEIDVPGHVNAALASYPELSCDGNPRPLYTGIEVGFSSLCATKDITYAFLDDVVGELAELTPGPYIHIGGDETMSTPEADYVTFIGRAQRIVEAHGKAVVGWAEMSKAPLSSNALAQYWDVKDGGDSARAAADQGLKVIASPADRSYLDMKYDPSSPIGLHWAGYVGVEASYAWDPGSLGYVPAASVIGVEAPLWTETVRSLADIEYLAFPRLAGIAEIGWSPANGRDWQSYRARLALQGRRWTAMGVNFFRSPEVDWGSTG